MLRVKKLTSYVAEKLKTENDSCFEILCGETVLTPAMTLAAIRQHILKTGGDIPLYYRIQNKNPISN
ncbi:hypothetical protein BY458DRAFT_522017 [Sporodiniella umbellata]|nr:hypothetical protein BY458DRAFT_522017 [Sporodiniella umbellata]